MALIGTLLSGPVFAQDEAPEPPKPPDTASAAETKPGVTISGTVEANYTYNFNRPQDGSNFYLYNTNSNQFALNLADIRIGKAVTDTSRTGFVVRLVEGEVRRRTFNPGEYNNTGDTPYVLEAYVSYLVPLKGRDLKVDFGQFVTHVGYETIEIGSLSHFSRSFLFELPPPFYDAGLRASLSVGPNTTVSGYLYNRFNGAYDPGNSDIAPGFQVAHTFSGGSSLIVNGLTSRENVAYDGDPATPVNNKQQSILDAIWSTTFSGGTGLAFEGLYRWGKTGDDNSYDVYGIAGYLTLPMGDNVLALRGEYLKESDGEGFIVPVSGSKPSLSSVTATYVLNSALLPNTKTMFELRYDRASDPFFVNDNGSLKKGQFTATFGQVFSF